MSAYTAPHNRPAPFQVLAKPSGAQCNLACTYCFYLEKEAYYPHSGPMRMSEEVLERYVQQYIAAQVASRPDVPELEFSWQGGEPTLMGLEFFRKVVGFQQKYAPPGKTVRNGIQTNGTLLTDAWCAFLKEHDFLVGLSIDGPKPLHDRYRVDRGGQPTFEKVMRGLEHLKTHGVRFNTLTVVSRHNSKEPLEVYEFLKGLGSTYHQYIPLVERLAPGQVLAGPPSEDTAYPVTAWSVEPKAYGAFLGRIFDRWIRQDVGTIFVQLFEELVGIWMGNPSSLCLLAETCGDALAIEHNGDVYACDHYVYPEYLRGNILEKPLGELAALPEQKQFGLDKKRGLPDKCKTCDVGFACHGECPKHRFLEADGQPGLSYLCEGQYRFLHHVDPYLKTMRSLIRRGKEASEIMGMIAESEKKQAERKRWLEVGRNEACPCGSGQKYKRCCWDKIHPPVGAGAR